MSIFEQSILNEKGVTHPDVFWYRFSSMCAQKVRRKVSPTFMPYIFFVKTKLNGLQILQKQNPPFPRLDPFPRSEGYKRY